MNKPLGLTIICNRLGFIILGLLTIISIILVLPYVAADSYTPYIHEPTLPPNPQVSIQGQYVTDLFSGAATYTYPLTLPPGIHELTPAINLYYYSHLTKSKPGLLGTGWSFSQDYIYYNPDKNTYVLVLNEHTYELFYDYTTSRYETVNYAPFFINQKSGSTSNSQGNYWFVITPDGTSYRFGYTSNSELINENNAPVRWSLDTITDTYSNAITYAYNENPYNGDAGAVYPASITSKNSVIAFVYENNDRPDIWTTYENNYKEIYMRRLAAITINTPNNQLIRKYAFTYKTFDTDARTALEKITEYGKDGSTSLPPTTFGYYENSKGWVENSTWQIPSGADFGNEEDLGTRLVDVNGDGKTDILKYSNETDDEEERTYINTGNGWERNYDQWDLTDKEIYFVDTEQQLDHGVRFGDFNGDHKEDIIRCVGDDSDQQQLWYNTGTGWTENLNPIIFDDQCFINHNDDYEDEGVRLVDLNGDGKTDIIKGKGSTTRAWLSNYPNGWAYTSSYNLPSGFNFVDSTGDDNGIRLADMNGDGLPDLIKHDNENYEGTVYLNTGTGWSSSNYMNLPKIAAFIDSGEDDEGVRLVDYNGDGLTDLIRAQAGTQLLWLNNGKQMVSSTWTLPSGLAFVDSSGDNKGVRTDDLNADGMIDLVQAPSSSTRKTWTNQAGKNYYLKTINNNAGGTTSITYQLSTHYDNTYNNQYYTLGFPLWIVNKLTHDNGMTGKHQQQTTITYDYQGGVYDTAHKEFNGFRQVTENYPDSVTKKHYYHQDYPKRGKEYQQEIYEQNKKLQTINNFWNNSNNLPYKTLLQETTTTIHDTTPLVSTTTYTYDTYLNPLTITAQGEGGTTNDNLLTTYTYAYNTNDWIITAIKELIRTNNQQTITKEQYTYDNKTYGEPPTQGSITTKKEWINANEQRTTTSMYTTHGNVQTITNPRGYTTTYTYDTTGTYPEKVTNALGQLFITTYDTSTGNILEERDANNHAITYTYDVFGRRTSINKPYDTTNNPTLTITYQQDGTAPETIIIKQREQQGTSNTHDNYYYYNGNNQLIQTNTEGILHQNYYYDIYGKINKISNPLATSSTNYQTPGTAPETTYTYDGLGRITSVTKADTNKKTLRYTGYNIDATDENGQTTTYQQDIYGRIIGVTEYLNTKPYKTTYTYNLNNNLLNITNPYSTSITYTYDYLGRKTQEQGVNYPQNSPQTLQTKPKATKLKRSL